jgi:catechol 2,3-dioxygenase-like lactoylglutathione lyase family enzyme
MKRAGIHHLGLATTDLDRTIEFYTEKLGWKLAWCDVINPQQGGRIRHAFFDTGDGSFFSFMSPEGVPGTPARFAADINCGLGLAPFYFHFAMWVDTLDGLKAKREELMAKGVEVTSVVDHEWARSIYFRDPNGLLLEYCVTMRQFGEEDKVMRPRYQPWMPNATPEELKQARRIMDGNGAEHQPAHPGS